jgi:hypothetical protein
MRTPLPLDLVSVARLDEGDDVSKEAAKLFALELFREDKVSMAAARRWRRLCSSPPNTPFHSTMESSPSQGCLRMPKPLQRSPPPATRTARVIVGAGRGAAGFMRARRQARIAYCTTSVELGNANLRPTSSMTLIWQRYRPGARSLSGTCICTGTALGRVDATCVALMGPASNAFWPF